MKNNLAIAVLIIAGAAAVLLFVVSRGNEPTSGLNVRVQTPPQETSGSLYEPKVDSQGAVTITVTPRNLAAASQELKFDIVMSTHSVELDQDMVKVAVLVDDSGREYEPLRWEGAPPGGHHREGTLIFAPATPYPRGLTLKIENIGDVRRSFSWELK